MSPKVWIASIQYDVVEIWNWLNGVKCLWWETVPIEITLSKIINQ